MDRRSDRLTALLIDAAVNAAASHGAIGAVTELVNAGIAWEVIRRVLNRPDQRRTYTASTNIRRSNTLFPSNAAGLQTARFPSSAFEPVKTSVIVGLYVNDERSGR
jgi:hypothetical protein